MARKILFCDCGITHNLYRHTVILWRLGNIGYNTIKISFISLKLDILCLEIHYNHCMAIWVVSNTTIIKQYFPGHSLVKNVTPLHFFTRNNPQRYTTTVFIPEINPNDIPQQFLPEITPSNIPLHFLPENTPNITPLV